MLGAAGVDSFDFVMVDQRTGKQKESEISDPKLNYNIGSPILRPYLTGSSSSSDADTPTSTHTFTFTCAPWWR